MVKAYHRRYGLLMKDQGRDNLHVAMHTIVENQLALNDGDGPRVAYLVAEGMSRHEAIHEVARDISVEIGKKMADAEGVEFEDDRREWTPGDLF